MNTLPQSKRRRDQLPFLYPESLPIPIPRSAGGVSTCETRQEQCYSPADTFDDDEPCLMMPRPQWLHRSSHLSWDESFSESVKDAVFKSMRRGFTDCREEVGEIGGFCDPEEEENEDEEQPPEAVTESETTSEDSTPFFEMDEDFMRS